MPKSPDRSPDSGAKHAWIHRVFAQPLAHLVGGPARLKVIVLLACVLALDAADKATVGAVAGELKTAFSIDNVDIGWLVTASTAMGALVTLPFGALVDRTRRTRLLTWAIVGWSVAMAVGGASSSYVMLLLSRLFLGCVVAIALPVITSLTGDFFRAHERGRIFGYIMAGELIGVSFGFLVSGNVAGLLSWRVAFWILAVLGIGLALLIWRLLPEPARGGASQIPEGARKVPGLSNAASAQPAGDAPTRAEDDTLQHAFAERAIEPRREQVLEHDPSHMPLWQAVRYIFSIRSYRTMVIASALGYFYFAGVRTFAIVFMRERFSMGQAQASSISVGLGLGAIVGVLLAGRIGDDLVRRGRLSGRVIAGACAYIAATLAFVPGILGGSLWVVGPALFIASAGVGGANPVLEAARLDVMHASLWGRAAGVQATCRFALEAIAPPLFGYVSSLFGNGAATVSITATGAGAGAAGLQMAFLLLLAPLGAAGVLLLWRTRRTYQRDVATAMASAGAAKTPALSAGR